MNLERWIARTIDIQADPADRQVLHGYAVWHHLRRLRHRLGGAHATHLQALNVRCHVTAAANLLAWLANQGCTLATCTQADLDRWATDPGVSYRDETGHFVRWAVQHRHASELTFGTHRWQGPSGPLDTEKRWADARRLLHDTTLKPSDRVAGLLLVLYPQRTATISQLTTDHVHLDSDHVEIMLGTAPVVLPEPLADPVRELVAARRGHAAIGAPGRRPLAVPRRSARPAHQRRPARPAPPAHRPEPPAGPVHGAVHARHRTPGRGPRPDARYPHHGRGPMAAGRRW